MQLTKTIFPDSVIFIEKKRVENRLWRKSAFCGEKVKNAGEKKNSLVNFGSGGGTQLRAGSRMSRQGVS
jgi:hypothetical protein